MEKEKDGKHLRKNIFIFLIHHIHVRLTKEMYGQNMKMRDKIYPNVSINIYDRLHTIMGQSAKMQTDRQTDR